MKKRLIALILSMLFLLSFTSAAFADESNSVKITSGVLTEQEINELVAKAHGPDANVLHEQLTRGTQPPSQYWDLAGFNYYGGGSFEYRLYTNYYFRPNSNNTIYVSWNVKWHQRPITERGSKVILYRKELFRDTEIGQVQSSRTAYNPYTGEYEDSVAGWATFSNLTPGDYYIVIEKTWDSEMADLSIALHH